MNRSTKEIVSEYILQILNNLKISIIWHTFDYLPPSSFETASRESFTNRMLGNPPRQIHQTFAACIKFPNQPKEHGLDVVDDKVTLFGHVGEGWWSAMCSNRFLRDEPVKNFIKGSTLHQLKQFNLGSPQLEEELREKFSQLESGVF